AAEEGQQPRCGAHHGHARDELRIGGQRLGHERDGGQQRTIAERRDEAGRPQVVELAGQLRARRCGGLRHELSMMWKTPANWPFSDRVHGITRSISAFSSADKQSNRSWSESRAM